MTTYFETFEQWNNALQEQIEKDKENRIYPLKSRYRIAIEKHKPCKDGSTEDTSHIFNLEEMAAFRKHEHNIIQSVESHIQLNPSLINTWGLSMNWKSELYTNPAIQVISDEIIRIRIENENKLMNYNEENEYSIDMSAQEKEQERQLFTKTNTSFMSKMNNFIQNLTRGFDKKSPEHMNEENARATTIMMEQGESEGVKAMFTDKDGGILSYAEMRDRYG